MLFLICETYIQVCVGGGGHETVKGTMRGRHRPYWRKRGGVQQ